MARDFSFVVFISYHFEENTSNVFHKYDQICYTVENVLSATENNYRQCIKMHYSKSLLSRKKIGYSKWICFPWSSSFT